MLWPIRSQNSGHGALRNFYSWRPRQRRAVPGLHPPIGMLYLILISSRHMRIHKTKIHVRNRRRFPLKRQNLTVLFTPGSKYLLSLVPEDGSVPVIDFWCSGKPKWFTYLSCSPLIPISYSILHSWCSSWPSMLYPWESIVTKLNRVGINNPPFAHTSTGTLSLKG